MPFLGTLRILQQFGGRKKEGIACNTCHLDITLYSVKILGVYKKIQDTLNVFAREHRG